MYDVCKLLLVLTGQGGGGSAKDFEWSPTSRKPSLISSAVSLEHLSGHISTTALSILHRTLNCLGSSFPNLSMHFMRTGLCLPHLCDSHSWLSAQH